MVLEPGRAVPQVRDGEEGAGIAAQHRKQTGLLFLAGLGRAHKGPCCELNAVCSWQAPGAALQVGLCSSASAAASSLHFPGSVHFWFYSPILPGAESGPAAEKDQSQLWVWGPLTPRSKHRLLSLSLSCAPSTCHALLLLNITTHLLCREIYIKNYDVLR